MGGGSRSSDGSCDGIGKTGRGRSGRCSNGRGNGGGNSSQWRIKENFDNRATVCHHEEGAAKIGPSHGRSHDCRRTRANVHGAQKDRFVRRKNCNKCNCSCRDCNRKRSSRVLRRIAANCNPSSQISHGPNGHLEQAPSRRGRRAPRTAESNASDGSVARSRGSNVNPGCCSPMR